MPRLALNLLVLNGAEVLPRMLKSVLGAVDELVILDTGSNDDTYDVVKHLASEFHAGRFWYERLNPKDSEFFTVPGTEVRLLADWAKARNVLLEHTTADYVLKMDADDELLSPVVNLLTTCQCLDDNPRISFIDAPYEIMSFRELAEYQQYTRLWRRSPEIAWKQVCHEYLTGKTLENTLQTRAGLRVVDWRDSPGQNVRLPQRNFHVLENYRQNNLKLLTWQTKEDLMFRYTWAAEALKVMPLEAKREICGLMNSADFNDKQFVADLWCLHGDNFAAQGRVSKAATHYRLALSYNPLHFKSIIQLFRLLDTDDHRADTAHILDPLRAVVQGVPDGAIPSGCDLRVWRRIRGGVA